MIPPVSDRERARWRASFARLSDAELVAAVRRLTALAQVAVNELAGRDLDGPASAGPPAYRPGASGGLALAPSGPARPRLRVVRPDPEPQGAA